jgi:hypothetical protein
MRKKVLFAFVIVNLISMLISPVAFGQSSGPFTVFLPMVVGSGGSNQDNPIPEVSSDVHHDTSAPLAQLAAAMPKTSGPSVIFPAKPVPPFPSTSTQADTVQQPAPKTPIGVTMGLSFPGIGQSDHGFSPIYAPPDTTLAVGDTQVVQWVNTDFAVFDKATGALIYGPIDANALWNGFGGGCQTNNDGDPMIQWDQIAHRWVFAQFSVSTLPYLYCLAVSTTSDATGSFYRYSYSYTNFPDYAKMGVWPDAYYVTFNMFVGGTTFAGARDCAFDRAKMLAGLSATQICFQRSTVAASDLPADLDGTTLPPAGAPNYLLDIATSSSLRLTKFHVNFTTPASSTLTSVTIPIAAFTPACGGGVCITQPGTSNKLDSLGDRLMYRLSYRNYGTYEALVFTHSVTSSWGTSGIRWYEIRSPGGSPVVFQQSTYAPDRKFRWMGSIAQDKMGNFAVGYSISDSDLYPSIRFTGRLVTDAHNTLRAENTLFGGAGSQLATLNRWGDYSTMDVDPVNGCTFWYTNEYLKADGTFNWSTWISSFKFPNCV